MTYHSENGSTAPRIPLERINQVQGILRTISVQNGAQNDYQLAVALGVNSAHLSKFRIGHLSPTLDRVLVDAGYLEPLPEPIPIYPCACGEVHTRKTCPHKVSLKRNPRISISKVDMERAAGAILRNLDEEDVGELIDLLLEVDDDTS